MAPRRSGRPAGEIELYCQRPNLWCTAGPARLAGGRHRMQPAPGRATDAIAGFASAATTMRGQACATGALHCEALHTTTYERGGTLLNISCRANREGHMIRRVSGFTILALGVALNFAQPRSVFAWGDEWHEVVALVAQS